MIGSIIANDHAEARRPCMLRTTGSFAALFAPYTEQVAARVNTSHLRFRSVSQTPQGQAAARSDAISDRMSEDVAHADARAGDEQ